MSSAYSPGFDGYESGLGAEGLEDSSLPPEQLKQKFFACATAGDWPVMSSFLSRNLVHVNDVDAYESTALHLAVRNQHLDVVRGLLDCGANASAIGRYGTHPLHSACHHDSTPIPLALLASGALADVVDDEGHTPLHYAAQIGSRTLCQLLIVAGANVGAASKTGRTPFHVACACGHASVVGFLLDCGVDVSTVDSRGYSALHIACANGKGEIVRILIDAGSDVYLVSKHLERLPLHCAVLGGDIRAVNQLILCGTTVTDGDQFGHTPLYLARKVCRRDIAQVLMVSGASE